MGTASRKTWLEKQTPEVQKEILAMDENAMTLEAMAAALKDLYGITVPVSTLGNALKIYHDTQALRWAAEWGADWEKQVADNPHIQPSKLAKAFLSQKMATASFRGATMDAADVVSFSQAERRMDLDERKTKAIERRNELQKEKNDLQRSQQEFQEKKWRTALEAATDEAKEKLGKGENLTIDDINRIRERTFGLPAVEQTTEALRH